MRISLTMLLGTFMLAGLQDADAQSTFLFQNYFQAGSSYNAPIYDAVGNLLAGTGYRAELYGGATSDSLHPLLNWDTGLRSIVTFHTGSGAGYVGGGVMNVDNVGFGGWAYLQINAWDASLGSTYEAAAAQGLGGYGESNVIYLEGGDPSREPAGAPTKLFGLQSFSLLPVPEPSATALWLLGIGLAAGLHGRRRKLKT